MWRPPVAQIRAQHAAPLQLFAHVNYPAISRQDFPEKRLVPDRKLSPELAVARRLHFTEQAADDIARG